MQKTDLTYSLALIRAPHIGSATYYKLQEHFPDFAYLFSLSSQELKQLGLPEKSIDYLKNPDWKSVEKDLLWAEEAGNFIVSSQDPCYPVLLREATGSPPLLFVKGPREILLTKQIAIVGSRNPTPLGLESAYQFAKDLVKNHFTVTSGLALGIDAASHEGALDSNGLTIAVMGTGHDTIYPARHKNLAKKILEKGGALVSEFPPGMPPKAENFPRRNRIISGLSLGVLVVEAALQSGSLITARYANEQGREVFAIPGSIHNPLAKGCHAIIRQGAKLVETSQDILEELGALDAVVSAENKPDPLSLLDQDYKKLVECVGFEATSLDTIIARSGFSVERVASMLSFLELKACVSALSGGYVRI
jgi:DNA processing protein